MAQAMKIKKITLNQITNFVVLVVASLIAINIYQIQNKKIMQIRQVQNEHKKKNEILLRIGDLIKRIELYKQKFNQKDRREIINSITNLAQAAGVKIVSLKSQEKPPTGMEVMSRIYDKIFFNLIIQVDGYHQLGEFISSLENNPMIFTIESITARESSSTQTEAVTRPQKLQLELIISELFFKG